MRQIIWAGAFLLSCASCTNNGSNDTNVATDTIIDMQLATDTMPLDSALDKIAVPDNTRTDANMADTIKKIESIKR